MADVMSQEEAERLISLMKKLLEQDARGLDPGEKHRYPVDSIEENEHFLVQINRGRIRESKYNYCAKILSGSTVLLELHINPTKKHQNPDGEIIAGNHWHVYQEGYGIRYAYPAGDIQSDDFVSSTLTFLKRFHVVTDSVNVYDQLKLEGTQ